MPKPSQMATKPGKQGKQTIQPANSFVTLLQTDSSEACTDPPHSPALLPQHVPVVHTLPAQPAWLPRLKLMDHADCCATYHFGHYSTFIRAIFPLLKPILIDANELIILRDQLEPLISDLTPTTPT